MAGGSGSASARGQSPSERAAYHASKTRLRESRKSATPGPGAYSVNMPRSARGYVSAFKSGSRRLNMDGEGTGDPGAYDAYAAREMAAVSGLSFGRSNRSGSGAFGASSARDMKLDIMGEDTPGPGTYRDQRRELGKELFTKGPSSAFRSSSAQRARVRAQDNPGAGAYDVNLGAVEPGSANGGASMRSRQERFRDEKQNTENAVGPGSYEGGRSKTIAGGALESINMGGSAAFRSDTVRHVDF